jgi:hypothetical protein
MRPSSLIKRFAMSGWKITSWAWTGGTAAGSTELPLAR